MAKEKRGLPQGFGLKVARPDEPVRWGDYVEEEMEARPRERVVEEKVVQMPQPIERPEPAAKVAGFVVFLGFNLTFFPQFVLGYLGMPRRYHVYPDEFQVLNVFSTAGCLEHIEHGHDLPGCVDAPTVGLDSNTLLVGVSGRVRISQRTYLVGSVTPRASGFRPGVSLKTFGIERRAGGHVFQLNFSNSIGSTMAQIARGGANNSDWFMGFNISRKFF